MAPASRAVPSFLGAMIVVVYLFVYWYELNCGMYIFLFSILCSFFFQWTDIELIDRLD